MRTVILDDEPWILEGMEEMCRQINFITELSTFTNPLVALDYIKSNPVELAILDIKMPGMNGLELGKIIKEYNPDIAIIYSTGYDDYALDAYKLHALAYILKPCNINELTYAISVASKVTTDIVNEHIFIKTFGRFDIFINGKPIIFKRAKAKELLALLVDQRGGVLSMDTAIDILWGDKLYDNNVKQLYRDAICQLRKTLTEYGCEDILHTVRAGCFLDTSKFVCDYYNLMNGNKDEIPNFNEEYMFDYSWGEYTIPLIHKKIESFVKK